MKIKHLDLKAVGPFTDKSIAFDGQDPGLHIIYGPNEAGKSSSLRALKSLLYGFDQRTPDNFIHSYDQLLVGGCLENREGAQITFQRRKKRIKDIVDQDGHPLDPEILSPFMRGIGPELFESLYGIDHDTLVRGGEDMLDQKGEVGQALFAAGAGISSLKGVLDELDQEAEALFKPKGKLPLINKSIKRVKTLRKEVNAASLSIREWQEHQKTLKRALEERSDLEKERERNNEALHRLERLKQAIPELAALASRQDQLEALGHVVHLDPGFSQTHRQVAQEMREAAVQLDRDSKRLGKLREKGKTISVNRDLLLVADQVDDFHQRLGEYRKGSKDRPERNGMRISLRTEAARLLKQVRPELALEEVETLRPLLSRKRSVQSLIPRYEAIWQQLNQAVERGKAAERDHLAAGKKLSGIPGIKPVQALAQAVKLAQKAGDIDAQLEQRRHERQQTRTDGLREIQRMGLWSGDLADLMALSLPMAETVHQNDRALGQLEESRRGLEKDRQDSEKALKTVRTQIKETAYSGEVPSEAALIRIREKREQGWQLLRRQWLEHEDVVQESRTYAPGRPLAEAYEEKVHQADHMADRLRREADRVAHAATLNARIETLEEDLAENSAEMKQVQSQIQEQEAAWEGLWQSAGIAPLSPKEMSAWLAAVDKLRFRVEEMLKEEQAIQASEERRRDLRRSLENELKSMEETGAPGGEALSPLLVFAETLLEDAERGRVQREKLEERQAAAASACEQADRDIEGARQSLDKWQKEWKQALSGLGRSHEVTTVEAMDMMETLQSCFDKLHAADDMKKRIDGIDRDARALEEEVAAVARKVAPDLSASPTDQTILKLRAMLAETQKQVTLHDEISREIETVQEEMAALQKRVETASRQMNQLLRDAKCEKEEDLAGVIARFENFQRLQEKISDLEAVLAKIGAGQSLEALSRQAREVNADALPGMIASLKGEIEQRINPQINRVSQIIGEKNNQLAAMDGSARAAEIAEQMEQELAATRRHARRYVMLKLASRTLQQEIERYREEHQGPVLKIASGYFKDLTVGSFAGLRTDVDDKGTPVLVGVRPDNAWLTVEKMSSGTRDQLFLSLRLATVVWRLGTSEPMPFIVDDILINFDDRRAGATLEVLADVSEKNQVIVFTHHRQIVEAAEKIQPRGTICVHRL